MVHNTIEPEVYSRYRIQFGMKKLNEVEIIMKKVNIIIFINKNNNNDNDNDFST